MPKDNDERLAVLEERYEKLEERVLEIEKDAKMIKTQQHEAALASKDLSTSIALLNTNIQNHIEMHNSDSTRKMRSTDIILILIGLALTVISLLPKIIP